MRIRKATIVDSNSILDLLDQYDREPDPRPSESDVGCVFSTYDNRADGIFVAKQNDEIVGTFQIVVCSQLNHSGRPFAVVENVIVSASYRRQGIGKAMMNKAIEVAKDAGCSKVILVSGKQRPYNHQFYESCGFIGHKRGFQILFDV